MNVATRGGRLIRLPSRTSGWRTDPQAGEASGAGGIGANRAVKETLHVLLVEDEPGDARLVEYALRMSSSPVFLVKHVSTLTAAIAHMGSGQTVDVILLDLSLPDSTGIATVSRMQEAAPRTPMVIMTGLDDPRFAAYALEVGAQDYLIKSDDPERTVGRAIRYAITRMASQLERQALLERIAEQQRHLVDEVNAARAMQFDLLPRPERLDERLAQLGIEVESFFEPSSGIGGDLWGCLDSGGPRMTFYCFDFTGHGIGAALNVFRLHALIADHWDPDRSPGETLSILSAALKALLGRGQFATMFLATIDTHSGEMEWASAGAPAPVVMIGAERRFLDARGIPLGLSATAQYRNNREPFPAGAALFMYSDAITDAPVEGDHLFGESGLMDAIGLMEGRHGELRVEHLLDEVCRTVQLPFEDDLTAVCIRRLAGAAQPAAQTHPAPAAEAQMAGSSDGLPPLTLSLVGGAPANLAEQCRTLSILLHQGGPLPSDAAIRAGEANPEMVRGAMSAPYRGFVELDGDGLHGVGLRCLETARAGGLTLSLHTASVYRLETLEIFAQAIRDHFGPLPADTADLLEISLAEALSNAVIHGNLGIPNHLRTTAEGFVQFQKLMHSRMNDPSLAARRIEMNVRPSAGGLLMVSVSDQGAGFDLESKLAHTAAATAKNGRGLALIRKATHALHTEDGGRTLVMTFPR